MKGSTVMLVVKLSGKCVGAKRINSQGESDIQNACQLER